MSKSEPNFEVVADALGSLLHEAQPTPREPQEQAARAQLLARAALATKAPRRRVPPLAAIPALAVAAALIVWWALPSALSYEVIGANKDGAYVSAPSDHAVSLHFSDDTSVEVAAGSQLRVEDTNRRGARVFLERGTANVHVVHQPRTRWTFAAGPFEVLVTGTRFDLNWDPSREVLELRLREGSVEIQTPFGALPVALRAGQVFHADLHQRSMTTMEATASPAPTTSPTPATASGGASPANGDSEPSAVPSAHAIASIAPGASGSNAAAARASWSKLVAAGQFATVLAQANERGTSNCLKTCSPSELSALADAARYSGGSALAGQSLQALRTRFSSTSEGRSAAFLLGRLSERQGATSEARSWYVRYLSEAPGGPYAAEALAGKMRATMTLDGRSAAAPIARDYLRLYPSGVQATTARRILGTP